MSTGYPLLLGSGFSLCFSSSDLLCFQLIKRLGGDLISCSFIQRFNKIPFRFSVISGV